MNVLQQGSLGGALCLLAALSCAPAETFAQPTNDNFSNAALLEGATFEITADNAQATVEPGEPAHPPPAAGHTLWWTWTAPGDGWIEFQVDSESAIALAIYTGDCLTNLVPAQHVFYHWLDYYSGCILTNPQPQWVVRGGTNYHIAVSAATNDSGSSRV